MGLFGRLFGNAREREAGAPASTQFRESEPDTSDDAESRNAPRRELVQVILRDTMRKHGIPSDWIECRILSTVNKVGRHGLHVNFVVRQAHEQMLGYVFAFQDSFEREIARYEPRARDWLLSVAWEFQGASAGETSQSRAWASGVPAPLSGQAAAGSAADKELKPLEFPATVDPRSLESEPPKTDEDVQRDLAALFAIRDAALAQAAGRRPPEGDDFQPTQPFADSGDGAKK